MRNDGLARKGDRLLIWSGIVLAFGIGRHSAGII
jgi:hypothetical protein